MLLCCILDVYLTFLFVCTESLTLVSDPTSPRFIRWLLFQSFFLIFFSPTCPKAKFRNFFYLFKQILSELSLVQNSKSCFTCTGLRASGLVWRLQLNNRITVVYVIMMSIMIGLNELPNLHVFMVIGIIYMSLIQKLFCWQEQIYKPKV